MVPHLPSLAQSGGSVGAVEDRRGVERRTPGGRTVGVGMHREPKGAVVDRGVADTAS